MDKFLPLLHGLLGHQKKFKSLYSKELTSWEYGVRMNIANSSILRRAFFGVTLSVLPFIGAVSSEELPPPKYETIDRYGVNVSNGKVSVSQNDISIGGNLGLSHTISSYTSNFVNYDGEFEGYNDNFRGGVMRVKHTDNPPAQEDFYVMRAFGDGSSIDFIINGDGTYTGLQNELATLEQAEDNTFTLTKADGTVITYTPYGGSDENARGYMSKIVKPNGFTIKIHKNSSSISAGIESVTTNTGFQLKYLYEMHERPLESSKQSATNNPLIPADSLNWSLMHPKYIKAINNAVEYCDPVAVDCALNSNWPKVTYDWPDGMPRAMYIGDSVFTVTDAMNRVTEYHHKAIDEVIYSSSGEVIVGTPGESYVPRIVRVKDATSNVISMNYDYKNVARWVNGDPIGHFERKESAQLTKAWVGDDVANYSHGQNWGTGGMAISNRGGGHQPIHVVAFNTMFNVPVYIETWQSKINLIPNYENKFINSSNRDGSELIVYGYDDRGNINKLTKTPTGTELSAIVTEADFDVECSNRKTCNQANWIKDGNGNQTDYTYHPESGQIASITLPANEQGVRPQTRYTYTEKFATYKVNSDASEQSPDGIWLLTAEKYCQNSNYTGSACTGNDEIVIGYEYTTSNLLLKGKTITADGKTLRTCYSYDNYGNRIGETKPKAGLTTCP
ncbi:hypothetical protein tinsulaeT_20830 [Thalassotalea insulae]|uniref:YD repeat-containing protein n=1 Tax=Thalassotalea insulae TaxID=2056778 RepID=A0ABQ6GS18_9GAMM|nr:hypothetical protein [Thalassotalea insulae]GLX78743.1 hypothetical protein tinsulaeT_20830 [Thalassotalea insulae]